MRNRADAAATRPGRRASATRPAPRRRTASASSQCGGPTKHNRPAHRQNAIELARDTRSVRTRSAASPDGHPRPTDFPPGGRGAAAAESGHSPGAWARATAASSALRARAVTHEQEHQVGVRPQQRRGGEPAQARAPGRDCRSRRRQTCRRSPRRGAGRLSSGRHVASASPPGAQSGRIRIRLRSHAMFGDGRAMSALIVTQTSAQRHARSRHAAHGRLRIASSRLPDTAIPTSG